MTASPPPLRSTRLENLRFEGNHAWLELDGEPVELTGESAAPALHSVQAFFHTAQQAYQAQPNRSSASPGQPWWQRMRGWITDWVGNVRSAVSRIWGPGMGVNPTVLGTGPSALGTTRPTGASAPSAPAASTTNQPSRAAPAPAAVSRAPTPSAPAAAPSAPPVATSAPMPLLRAAFADEKGVHLIWRQPSAKGPAAERELIYPFDSPVAAGLQACYGQLAELGHAVVDLGAWQPAVQPSPKTPAPAPREPVAKAEAKSGTVSAPAERSPVPEAAASVRAAAKSDPGKLMLLHPGRSDIASRLVVVPAAGDPKPEVITGAETFFNALHAAADPAVPEAERLTFLTCRQVKGELKVAELGFGRQAGDIAAPARTETAAAWWKHAQKVRSAEAKPEGAATPNALGTTRSTPDPAAAHQVELFGG